MQRRAEVQSMRQWSVDVSASAWKMENLWWKNSLKEDELFYIMGKEFIDCETARTCLGMFLLILNN